MNLKEDKYIILEIIPTSSNPFNGEIIQLSALKIDGLKLVDRFDYRLKDEYLPIKEMKSWIDYDIEQFNYVEDTDTILNDFNVWSNELPILIIDNIYTEKYLNAFSNKIDYIYKYLNLEYSDMLINNIVNKYKLHPSNHIVDLLFEALIYHFN